MKNQKVLLIALVVIVGLFAVGIVKDQVMKVAVTVGISKASGAPVRIGGLSVGVIRPSLRIKDFKMYQPKGYPKGIMLDIPTISVDCNLWAFFKKKIHVPLIELDLKEAVFIRDERGLSVDSLKVAKKEAPEAKKAKSAKPMAMQIDVLKLNLGRVILKEITAEGEPSLQIHDINIKEKTYKNITSMQQLVGLLMIESMKPAAIKGAGIYSAVSFAGVAFLPAAAVGIFTGKDTVADTFPVSFNRAYRKSLDVLGQMGEIKSEDKEAATITAVVNGATVILKIEQKTRSEARITISARKFLLSKIQIAGTVLHKLTEALR
ncbi:MAG: hypothetical protein JSW17_04150 [Candidatus Omnitrophota bacterium]|nr:MAG: hypothetical protein JSW17_04150 [Candidatus Omnitrophota bacterium]